VLPCPLRIGRISDPLTVVGELKLSDEQYLFNRIVLAAWNRRSMTELNVTREAFMEALRGRGWSYDAKHHAWRKGTRANQ
jgi:hypothetical protein